MNSRLVGILISLAALALLVTCANARDQAGSCCTVVLDGPPLMEGTDSSEVRSRLEHEFSRRIEQNSRSASMG